MVGTILITGGTGKTGSVLANKLQAGGYKTLLTTRNPAKLAPPLKGVRFDWFDPSTYENPFTTDSGIDRIYLVCPEVADEMKYVKPFVELALAKGVKRIVLLSATVFEKGGPGTGTVHAYLDGLGVEYHALRPTWFFENFTTVFLGNIKKHNQINTATQQGKCSFISVDDITRVAMESLVGESVPNSDTFILGPELLSYDDAAKILSEVTGRTITHKQNSEEVALKLWVENEGVPEKIAKAIIWMESLIRDGTETKHINAPNKIVGKQYLRDFFVQNKEAFAPA